MGDTYLWMEVLLVNQNYFFDLPINHNLMYFI